MRPRFIEVRNFLGHRHERVALPDSGIFFLSGPSGAGKSSFVVDAVGYALFGARGTRTTQQKLRNKHHSGEPMEVRVMLEFDDGTRLTVARGTNAKGVGWAELYQPDPANPSQSVLLAEGGSRVGREVRKRLGGMTPQQFYAAFVARQKDIALLTSLRGKERRDTVHRMLGMRELEKAVEEVAARLRSARAQLKGLQAQLGDRTRESEDERIAELRAAYDRQRERTTLAERTLKDLKAELQAHERELQPLEAQAAAGEEAGRLESSLETRRSAREELRRAAERHQNALAQAEQVPALRDATERLQLEVDELRADYKRSDEHARASAEHATAEQAVAAARAACSVPVPVGAGAGSPPVEELLSAEELRTRHQLLHAQLDRTRSERQERDGELQRLRDSGECFTCLRPLGEPHDHSRVLAAIEGKLAELETLEVETVAELAQVEVELPRARERELRLEQAQRELLTAQARAELLASRVRELEASGRIVDDLDELKNAGRSAAEQLAAAREQLAAAQASSAGLDEGAAARLAEIDGLIAADEQALRDARAQSSAVAAAELAQRRNAAQALRSRVDKGEGQVPEMRKQLDGATRALEAAERERDALLDKLGRVEDVQTTVVRLEDLQTYLQGFQRKLAAEIRPALEEMSAEMLNQVSGGNHVSMRLNEDYEIEVQTAEGSWLEAELLSGGEEIRVNICLRLALTRLVSQRTGVPLRMLVLDEPLPAQDAGHVEHIMQLLDSLRPFYPQQFIISHVGDLRSSSEIDFIMDFAERGDARIALSYA